MLTPVWFVWLSALSTIWYIVWLLWHFINTFPSLELGCTAWSISKRFALYDILLEYQYSGYDYRSVEASFLCLDVNSVDVWHMMSRRILLCLMSHSLSKTVTNNSPQFYSEQRKPFRTTIEAFTPNSIKLTFDPFVCCWPVNLRSSNVTRIEEIKCHL